MARKRFSKKNLTNSKRKKRKADNSVSDDGVSEDRISVIKYSLASTLHDKNIVNTIKSDVNKLDINYTQTCLFLKVYLLHHYDKNERLGSILVPKITEELIYQISRLFNTKINEKKEVEVKSISQQIRDELIVSYNEIFNRDHTNNKIDNRIFQVFEHSNLIDSLKYNATQILTAYENNIKSNFSKYIRKYICSYFNVYEYLSNIKNSMLTTEEKKDQRQNLWKSINLFIECLLKKSTPNSIENIHDIIQAKINELNINTTTGTTGTTGTTLSKRQQYSSLLNIISNNIIPDFTLSDTLTDEEIEYPVLYYLKINPQLFFPYMIKMMKFIESKSSFICNLFPLRTSLVPHYSTFDTKYVHSALLNKEQRKQVKKKFLKITAAPRLAFSSPILKDLVYRSIFKKKIFKKKQIRYTISTDGHGISILYKLEYTFISFLLSTKILILPSLIFKSFKISEYPTIFLILRISIVEILLSILINVSNFFKYNFKLS